jgi:hypothetical protein
VRARLLRGVHGKGQGRPGQVPGHVATQRGITRHESSETRAKSPWVRTKVAEVEVLPHEGAGIRDLQARSRGPGRDTLRACWDTRNSVQTGGEETCAPRPA